MAKKNTSIRRRLTLWFLILTLIPLLFVLITTYFRQAKIIEETTFDKLTAIRNLKVQQLNVWLDEREANLRVISNDDELTNLEYLYEETSSPKKKQEVLKDSKEVLWRYLKEYPAYYELFLIDPHNGDIIVSTDHEMEGENRKNTAYFSSIMKDKKLYVSDIFYSRELQNYTMIWAMPVFCTQHTEKHLIGIICAEIDLQNTLFTLLLDRIGLGNTGETLIVNEDVIALNELRWYENAPLKLKISAQPAVRAAQGETGIVETTDYRNEEILAAYTYIDKTGWGFVCKQDLSELNAPLMQMLWNYIIIFLISISIILIITFRMSQKIAAPILEIDAVARRFGKGDYSVRNKLRNTGDELDNLADEFNRMADLTQSRLEVQQMTSTITELMIGKSNTLDFAQELLKKLSSMSEAVMATFYRQNTEKSQFVLLASIGIEPEKAPIFNTKNPGGEFDRTLQENSIYHLKNITDDTVYTYKTTSGSIKAREMITIPILVHYEAKGFISLLCTGTFKKEFIEALKLAWPAINTSYANLISGEETQKLAESLAETNEQLKKQSNDLQEKSAELESQASELIKTSDELQEQNIELEQQRKEVEQANQLKSEFLSNMSHELRTPLNSILALSRVLIMQIGAKVDAEENNYLRIIERNGKHLLELINSILDLSKIEAGKMEIDARFFHLKAMLQNITDSMQSLADEKGIDLRLKLDQNLDQIQSDESRLHQVILNIVGNAIKFTDKGYVEIRAFEKNKQICIEVIDSGIGISEEKLPHIFDEFRQADGTSSRHYEGTGLGLAIASKLIKILKGSIGVKSTEGAGSVFTITIPFQWSSETSGRVYLSKAIEEISGLSNKILVVDDDINIAYKIASDLKDYGYEVITAHTGKEALELAKSNDLLAITLDIIMPEMDGWEVLQRLKSQTATQNIPVLIISVSNDRDTGYALGAVGYINKPVQKESLIKEIRNLHQKARKILLVDDNPIELKMMQDMLIKEGFECILAEGGDECLSVLKENKPDLIILDLIMPGTDGFQVLDEIRSNPETQDMPVIIATAKDLTAAESKKLQLQATTVITKSQLEPEKVYEEIRRLLKQIENQPIEKNPQQKAEHTQLLVVEDNPDAVVQIRYILEKEGYRVDVCQNGREALDYMEHSRPAGIILDLMMPEVDGFEVLNQMRSSNETREIPVLILTAKDLSKTELEQLSSNNVQQLVQKGDVNVDELLFKIQLMLGSIPKPLRTERMIPKKEHPELPKKHQEGLKQILIIEDNPDNLVTIKAILGKDYNLIDAEDGESGIEKARLHNPDLILLDMALPGMDGMETLSVLKEVNKSTPVFAVTAQAMKGDRERFIEAGCDEYISKPIDPLYLKETVKNILEH